ncbi:ABC-F family ATP-binding cassette domain-containing protein [Sphingobacterium paramultivorum]|uniref:ABC-F family ATP-binding cassette domain-containing protein n=1 Tax=Sphingobacterium paramultivorum TaxID=2886510 RepID=A0A7G5E7F1_9SPHI|nr:ABC-F family ATP-binding cassette domain-containing protein [Sphingobacterium paramultivorum]QMV69926.1 ABC-F family ATP-binding cassette domain-containing protein [Sphingobacterium paramultivorum]WSO13754.1 ABC-F family ATP-binding cassette domain-containing protein [Sphingobacterium paramultivorum]
MSILATEQVSHSFHDRWLFKDLHFGLQKGDRVALVGINGTGKSTLLAILAERILPTSGKVVKEKGIKIGFLEQDPDFTGLKSINDFIYSTDNDQQRLIREYEELLLETDIDQKKLEDLSEKISSLNAWEYEHNIKTILNRLNIMDFHQDIKSLSGGQRKRLALAKLLIDEPDIYILDEPTNHLDIETIEWLEKLLTTGSKTVLLVTHDRYFLDNICTEIRELDRGNLYSYKGNYSYFLEKKSERETIDAVMVEKSRNLLRRELEWMRRQPQARGTKSKSRIEAYYDLEEKSKAIKGNDSVHLSVKVSRQGSKILELEHVAKRYGTKEIIHNFSYTFKKGDRIGLAGKNGTGKSTFLNLITGEEKPDSGSISVGETTVYGYYKQGGLEVNENDRVLDVVKNIADYIEMANGEVITASQLLTHFLFPPEKQFGFVNKLSGGEKKRLQLMRVLMKNPNFLILDEPSNDLDIDTLNVLEDFLDNYKGVLILVSHDRYLLDKLTDQLFIFEGKGSVQIYNGNYADFKLEQDEIQKLEKEKQKRITQEQVKPIVKEEKKKLSYKEQLEYTKLEEEIEKLETQVTLKTEKLNQETDHLKLSSLAEEIQSIQTQIDDKSERWLYLADFM